MFHKVVESIKIITSLGAGVVGYWLGGWDVMLKTIMIMVIFDYITGWLKAIFSKTLSSGIGFKGLVKKIIIFIIIVVANLLQELLNDTIPLRETIIMFYIVNEALSIVENAAYFVPIPEKLKRVLLQLNQASDEEKI